MLCPQPAAERRRSAPARSKGVWALDRTEKGVEVQSLATTGFEYVVEVKGQVVRLTTAPEDLVLQEL
jgi:hypothetical protein